MEHFLLQEQDYYIDGTLSTSRTRLLLLLLLLLL